MKRYLVDTAATEAFGGELARCLMTDMAALTVLLYGPLGAGKSTLARAFIRELGHTGPVPSPTYTLIEPYTLAGMNVYHIDLYRIGTPDELDFLGLEELDDGIRLIEWPERAPGLEAMADLRVRLGYGSAVETGGRQLVLDAMSDKGRPVLASMTAS